MNISEEQAATDFYRYPPVGPEDWEYGYATAVVRVLQTHMVSRAVFLDMANASSFAEAAECLAGTEYAISDKTTSLKQVESILLEKRTQLRTLFSEILSEEMVELLAAREDFANMRLAIRRVVTEKPIGTDYSNDGSVNAGEFEEIFESEDYSRFPKYLREAVEMAVLGYYQNKDIRRIDYEIDKFQAAYKIKRSCQLNNIFLQSLFRTQVDLMNIRTMLRLKAAERNEKEFFLPGGFVDTDRFIHCLDLEYEAIGPLFYATSYHDVVDAGANYLTSQQSFLRLEKECESYMMDFLKTTDTITAGTQPVIAYLLMKENEIRTVRMLMTCKMNSIDAKLIIDRLADF
jgi:V/A-type H+/Na+-transporting ATPase subunit C